MNRIGRQNQGAVIQELTFVLLILLVFAALIFEGSRAITAHLTLSTLTREMGSGAFRLCVNEDPTVKITAAEMKVCLADASAAARARVSSVLPEMQAALSVWRFDAKPGAKPKSAGNYRTTAKITPISAAAVKKLISYTADKRVLVVAEVSYEQRPLLAAQPIRHYDACVF